MKLDSVQAIVRALDTVGVRFLVAGGLAVNAHGYHRELRETLFHEKGMRVLQFWSDEHRETPVDVFVRPPFVFEEEYERADLRELAGVGSVRVVSLDTLIRMKTEADRPEDREDVRHLRMRQEDES